MPPSGFHTRNQLLLRLPEEELALLQPLELVELPLRMSLEVAGQPIEYAYFLEDGIGSIVAELGTKGGIEAGLIGREGMSGIALLYGDDRTPFDSFVQGPGSAWRIQADRLRSAIGDSRSLHANLLRYARSFSIQVTCTAYANGRCKLEERLARWLLMVSDRMGESFSITHDFLALMLAVRRPGVTVALHILEGKGLIKATRAQIVILDREGLVEAANGAYGLAEREHDRLMSAN